MQSQPLWHMIIKRFLLMGREEFWSLAPSTTQEARLRYLLFIIFCNHQRVFIFHTENLFVSQLSLSLVAVDVAGPYSKGQRWRLRRYWNLCVLEWTWTISWKGKNANIIFIFSNKLFPLVMKLDRKLTLFFFYVKFRVIENSVLFRG